MVEHATQFPEEYSKVASVQKKVRLDGGCSWSCSLRAQSHVMVAGNIGSRSCGTALLLLGCVPCRFHVSPVLTHNYQCAQVDEVKGIMTENIDKMLQRGEKLELLTDKTENLMFEVRWAVCVCVCVCLVYTMKSPA
jgi:hypothetical protein